MKCLRECVDLTVNHLEQVEALVWTPKALKTPFLEKLKDKALIQLTILIEK